MNCKIDKTKMKKPYALKLTNVLTGEVTTYNVSSPQEAVRIANENVQAILKALANN